MGLYTIRFLLKHYRHARNIMRGTNQKAVGDLHTHTQHDYWDFQSSLIARAQVRSNGWDKCNTIDALLYEDQ